VLRKDVHALSWPTIFVLVRPLIVRRGAKGHSWERREGIQSFGWETQKQRPAFEDLRVDGRLIVKMDYKNRI
jgi:hypothetical protein